MTDSNAFPIGTLFKTYDIRGIVPDQLTADTAYRIGRALVLFLQPDQVVVGRDMRVSGEMLSAALIDGIRDQGADVVDTDLVSTDALYFAAGKYGFPAGVMVTASHNPPEYNGFKIVKEDARALSFDEGIRQIRDLAVAGEFQEPASGKRGDLHHKAILQDYADHCLSYVDTATIKPLKVAVDAGNGMASQTVPLIFGQLPCKLIPLYFELDGTFPNHLANPLDPANMVDLQRLVVDEKCDLGVAFDGDADRVFLVDEQGKLIPGDITTAMVAIAMLEKHPGSAITYNLICSKSVPEIIAAHGGRRIRTPVGHSLIKQIMRAEDAVFGGEHSGHYYFRDNWYADSGLIAMLSVLELVSRANKPLSEVVAPLDSRFRSGEINMTVENKSTILARVEAHFAAEGAAIDHLDGITAEFPDRWFNLRASNTEPLLRLNVEGDTPEALADLQQETMTVIQG